MRKSVRTALLVGASMLLGTAALAAEGKNTIRLGLSHFEPTGDSTGVFRPVGAPDFIYMEEGLEVDSDLGFELSYERRLSDLVGLEGSLAYYKPDFDFRLRYDGADTREHWAEAVRVMPLTVALNFHLLRSDKLDVYVGPAVAYVTYDDYDFWPEDDTRIEVELKDEFAFGAQAGIDYALSPAWGLSFRMKYLRMKGEIDSIYESDYDDIVPVKALVLDERYPLQITNDFEPNPVTATLAVSYKF